MYFLKRLYNQLKEMTTTDIKEVHISNLTSWHLHFLVWIKMYCKMHCRAYFTWLRRGIWRSRCRRWLRSWRHWLWDGLSRHSWWQCSYRSWVHSHSNQMSRCPFCGEKGRHSSSRKMTLNLQFEEVFFFDSHYSEILDPPVSTQTEVGITNGQFDTSPRDKSHCRLW